MAKKDKTLLNEMQVRKFMKLASLSTLSDSFVNENNLTDAEEDLEEGRGDLKGKAPAGRSRSHGRGKGEQDSGLTTEEETLDELGAYRDEPELEEPGLEGPGEELEEPGLDPELEGPGEEPPGEVTLSDEEVDRLVSAMDAAEDVMTKLRAAAGEELGEPGEELGEPEFDLEPDEELEEPGEEPLEETDFEVIDDDELVERVLRRVTHRLVKEAIKE